MADRYLSPPGRSGRGGDSARESRILRDRMAAFDDALDRASSDGPFTAARMLVQTFSGGAYPTTTPAVYLTNPVLVTGPETEGGAGTLTVDSATTVPVVVLGQPPMIGDYLTAYAVGGRWVTDLLTKSSPPPNLGGCVLLTCSPCSIPRGDLTIAWTNTITGNGSATMTYSAAGQTWTATCVDNGQIFLLRCTGGAINFAVEYFTAGGCPGGTIAGCSAADASPNKLIVGTQTCSPFSLTFGVDATHCPGVFANGDTQFTITGPNTSFGVCPICIFIPCGAGATVTIADGMTTIATGTPDSLGNLILDIGSPGTYTITVSLTNYVTYTSTRAFVCGQGLSINLTPLPGFVYACGSAPACCLLTTDPFTLTITSNGSGDTTCLCDETVTLTYGPDPLGILPNIQWYGLFSCGTFDFWVQWSGCVLNINQVSDGTPIFFSCGMAGALFDCSSPSWFFSVVTNPPGSGCFGPGSPCTMEITR
jgi:hypothetical protein